MNAVLEQPLELTPIEQPAQLPAVQAPTNSPAHMMMALLDRGATLDQVEKMMDLQQRFEEREAEKAFNEALAAFKAENIRIVKRKLVDFQTKSGGRTTYKHAELDDVVAAVGPSLSKNGFAWSWKVVQESNRITVTCTLKHRQGHSDSVSLTASADESGGKNSIQAIVSTTTYLERHTLKAICGVAEAGEDNDGQGAGADHCPPDLLKEARDASLSGWAIFSQWIKHRTEDERILLTPHSDALKAAAKAADAKGKA